MELQEAGIAYSYVRSMMLKARWAYLRLDGHRCELVISVLIFLLVTVFSKRITVLFIRQLHMIF